MGAHARPREFARITDLSITKIYRLVHLDPELRRRLDQLLAHDDRLDRNVLTELHTATVRLADRLAAAVPRRRP